MGGFPNFAISFSIISILTGVPLLYGHGLRAGGPYVMTVGWPLVTIFSLLIAASMAEIASAIPTAGAMYHWSTFLGGRGYGWLTGWLNLLGQYSITCGITYGCAEFVAPLVGISPENRWQILLLFAGLLLSHGILNHFYVRLVSFLNIVSAWYHLISVTVFSCVLLAFAKLQHVSFLFTTGFSEVAFRESAQALNAPWIWLFCLGLLQAQWTFTGYDASAHISEETKLPRVNAPWGIFLSVAISGIFGYGLVLALTLAIPDLSAAATVQGQSVFMFIVEQSLGPQMGQVVMWGVALAMWFCGLSSLTANARMIYAFSRDGALPWQKVWARVHPKWRTPTAATWQAVVVAFVLALYSEAFSVIISIATISLCLAYALPIALKMRARWQGRWRPSFDGPWSLGRLGPWVNGLAVLWTLFISVLFMAPPNQQTGTTMLVVGAALAFYWFVLGERNRFKGPQSLATEEAMLTTQAQAVVEVR